MGGWLAGERVWDFSNERTGRHGTGERERLSLSHPMVSLLAY